MSIPPTSIGASFLDLPAELRIQIYSYILPAIPLDKPFDLMLFFPLCHNPSTLPALTHHRGFILSCTQIFFEFEAAWCAATNALLAALTQDTLLHTTQTPIRKYSDANHLAVRVEYDTTIESSIRAYYSQQALRQLVQCVYSLTLRPDEAFPPHDGTLRGFFLSPQRLLLYDLEQKATPWKETRIDYWDMALYIGPEQSPYQFTRDEVGRSSSREMLAAVGLDSTLEDLKRFRKTLELNGRAAIEFRAICCAELGLP